ncbi:hypothetical protein [Vibrio nigripulchritudo]|uniref:hypothetical protein n=1 Tax=Vibrio nigripulchritudo TaxID=28173 RepID=UPI002493C49B|nr:hypothetical protein [Vibrio nigripulchritudo]
MSKPVLFILISAILFLGLFLSKDILFVEKPVLASSEPVIETAKVLKLNKPVTRGSFRSTMEFSLIEVTKEQVQSNGLLTNEDSIPDGALFRASLAEGIYLKRGHFAYPSDDDYVNFTLTKDHIPYYYTTDGNSAVDAIGVIPGDIVSFISTTSQYSNIHKSEYKDIGNIISEVLVHKARVIKVLNISESNQENSIEVKKKQLVIELKIRDIMKLDIANKIGKISLIPANMASPYLSVRSVDILEKQHGVRELRAGAN